MWCTRQSCVLLTSIIHNHNYVRMHSLSHFALDHFPLPPPHNLCSSFLFHSVVMHNNANQPSICAGNIMECRAQPTHTHTHTRPFISAWLCATEVLVSFFRWRVAISGTSSIFLLTCQITHISYIVSCRRCSFCHFIHLPIFSSFLRCLTAKSEVFLHQNLECMLKTYVNRRLLCKTFSF